MNRVPRCPPDAPRQLPEQGQIRTGFSSHSPESSLWARISTATSSCPMLISSVATSYAPVTFRHCRSSGGDHAPDCLLYTSDAADEEDSVDLGGRRIIKKKKKKK